MNNPSQPFFSAHRFQSLIPPSSALAISSVLFIQPALAQSISVDGSTSTQLNGGLSCSGTCLVTGGLRDNNGSGPNLFHSFSTFNVDTGTTTTFQDPGVSTIFGRITGSTPSTIDGTLRVDGNANLFLLNPNGILFGEDASLDLKGSFLSTTADSLLFESNDQFSATTQALPALLNIQVPLGLQFGANPGPIALEGTGHNLTYNVFNFTIIPAVPSSGLLGNSGSTLALLGGDVALRGGNLAAPGGHVEVGSLGGGAFVGLSSHAAGWDFDYSNTRNFRDISLSQAASVNVSGPDAGSVNLQGRQISSETGSVILAKILQSGDGQIALNASESINFVGTHLQRATSSPYGLPTQGTPTGAYLEIGPGALGSDTSRLTVSSPQINLTAGAQIGIGMAGTGSGGRMEVSANRITADGGANAGPSTLFSGVLPVFGPPPGAAGQGGTLTIAADNIALTNGAQLIASTFGPGNAGDLNIEARNIEISGGSLAGPSAIVSASEVPSIPPMPNGSGRGGEIHILTERLAINQGGQVSVSTVSNNPAGNLIIEATEAIELNGASELGRSGLFASSLRGSGAGGDIEVTTRQLSLLAGATINASNFPSSNTGSPPGSGPAGDIGVTAQSIVLKDGSLITADTVSGDRANIDLRADSLVLRRGSAITTNATGSATGGNINLTAEALIAFENSDITANAADNFGGRVTVNANTILGTAYREQLTPESDITATSALGPAFSGTVEINQPALDPAEGISELPTGLAASDQIVAACEQTNGNAFVATGRGGLPEDTGRLISGQSLWNDFRFLKSDHSATAAKGALEHSADEASDRYNYNQASLIASQPSEIVEAQTWAINSNGQVVLGTYGTFPDNLTYVSSCLSS